MHGIGTEFRVGTVGSPSTHFHAEPSCSFVGLQRDEFGRFSNDEAVAAKPVRDECARAKPAKFLIAG